MLEYMSTVGTAAEDETKRDEAEHASQDLDEDIAPNVTRETSSYRCSGDRTERRCQR